jgi:dTDP-glucose 4,6-dehydratase
VKYFITGGAGFIGSNFVKFLFDSESHLELVTVFDSLTYAGKIENLTACSSDKRFNFIHGDIMDSRTLTSAMANHDVVVHFAAESHVDRSISSGSEFVSTNVLGSYNVFDSALRNSVGRVVHISTDEVYGSIETGSSDEKAPLLPNSPYAASKASSDLVARSFVETFGLNISITRCANNYGHMQHQEKLIPTLITSALRNQDLPIYGDGSNVREWIHVIDHCRAIQLVVKHGQKGEIYNVGSGLEFRNLDLARMILKLIPSSKSKIQFVDDRKGHDFRYSLNFEKIKELGFKSKENLERSLTELISHYSTNI